MTVMQSKPNILVVDDDADIRRLLGRYLDEQGFRVALAASGREMHEKLAASTVDLVVLDVMLPGRSGLDLCQDLRSSHPRIAIILLTALKEDVDRIVGLEIGADDYLGKPFNPRELIARIKAVLRRSAEPLSQAPPADVRYRFAGFTAERAKRRVASLEGGEVPLTGAEFDLLVTFLDRPSRVLSRDQLLDHGRGRRADPFDRSIDVLVSRVRRKLAEAGAPDVIRTVRNGGYQLVVRVETEPGTP
jgi:two-component system OmpR family response regulator